MKKQLLNLLLIFVFSVTGMQAQVQNYYYYKGQKISLELDRTSVNISTDENIQKSSITVLKVKDFNLETDKSNSLGQKTAKLEFENVLSETEFRQKIKDLKVNPSVNSVSFYYKRGNFKSIGTSGYFYVKLKNENDLKTLRKVAVQKNVQIVKQVPNMPQWYILGVKKGNEESSIDLSNYFYETGLFEDIDPAFMFDFKNNCTNDPNFGSLWGLNNAANPAIDINACQAWNVSQGSGVKIAVVDQGIDKTHNDLAGNISPLSFDAQSGTSPSVFYAANSHGTHVAGTIGAIKDNNLQVVGVAPQSKILSVSHTLSATSTISAELASGITWAYQNGADVINNSWGDQGGAYYGNLHSTILENAILNAMTLGRGNKGTVIVFASGNYASTMDYPANFHDDILTVGAITSTGSRAGFSGYGAKLDLVAPGNEILSTIPNNQTGFSNGTSMASPHAAGVCALILSANPNLTGQQVRDIIEQTSQKVGVYYYGTIAGRSNGTWNSEMGYGLVDAYAASMSACMGSATRITGNDIVCTNATYTAPSGGTTYNWSVTQGSALVTLSGNGTSSVVLTRTSQTVSGPITLNLYYGNAACGYRTITKNITVGSNFVVTSTGVGPNGQVDVSITGGAPPYNIYRGESTLIYTTYSTGSYTVNFGCGGGIFKVEANTSCGLTAVRKLYGGCSAKVSTQSAESSSVATSSSLYRVYPNPSSSIMNIALYDENNTPDLESSITAKLYDMNGNEKANVEVVNNNASLDVSHLKKGIYVLIISINGVSESHQVIVN